MMRYLPALTLAWICGCASLKQLGEAAFKHPTVAFKEGRLQEVSLSSATLDLVYSIANSNPVGLSLAEVKYALAIEGKEIIGGSPPNGLRIPANGTAELHLPVSLHFAELASTVDAFLRKDFASYEAKGEVGLATPLGTVQLLLAAQGQVEIPKVPKLEFGSPRIDRLSTQGATVSLPLTLTNRNSYSLPVENLSGSVRLAGMPLADINTGDVGELGAKSSHQLTLALAVHLRSPAEVALTRHGTAEIDFSGAVASGGASVPLRLTQVVKLQR